MTTKVLPSGKHLFDPYNESTSSNKMESTAGAMDNSTEGECPKCKGQMGTAVAAKAETVYYCSKCRVSSPIPN